ncbi:MAG: PhzF family phenazine biosynthesis protein [Chitinophagaceae bacterium]|nr:PhzF family phenazine biosynthesis protein [Chitinophagaceae bacterium]MBP6476759.1 PhzF family phenazine biosynthesis protein [Chitinophagaceae bacterium]MBP7108619.1 PhzF family phenazine biosynthesis protein [Chitinophagaceae bacterium]MBP7314562.1 PhzF family phenazine biosynthesis protein [Chitinophagaceae bacterium]HQZ49972.1 PhzF family phenazine biosynthesis protein [Chitinophagaceae bacterium]
MKLTIYQIDSFADKLFAGNPAAVIPLDKWIDDSLMQQLAMENNLAETAFFVPKGNDFEIRWFTPALEINLCGHATLASAFVLFNFLEYKSNTVTFHSKSGPLVVTRNGDLLNMDFPSWKPELITEYPSELLASLGNPEITGVYSNREYLVELMNEQEVRRCTPDFSLMKKVDKMVIITAPGKEVDFVSRFFAPTAGIDEDPVTGSAHSQLIPFWSNKLGKDIMQAKQLSKRGGDIYCEQKGERVIMGGQCVFYMKGEIEI